jgi:glycosyltransferase involved in cell wall biosynthesis
MKTVWILNHYSELPSGTSGSRHYYLAKYLRNNGWNAVLIGASTIHPSGRQRVGFNNSAPRECYNNVDYLWLKTPKYSGRISRIINMITYSYRALLPKSTADLDRPDIIIGSSVHPLAAISACFLARRHKVPFVFEVRDLWPQTLIDMGAIGGNGIIARSMRWVEKYLYKNSSRVLTLMPNAVDYIVQYGISREKVDWLPNGADLSSFPQKFECAGDVTETFVFMYFGAHGKANGLDVVINAYKLLLDGYAKAGRKIVCKLRLIGDGPLKSVLIEMATDLGLDSSLISFEEPVAKEYIPRLAKEADVFIISVLDLPDLYKYGISMNKIFDYMAAGRPILIASGAANNPVIHANSGISVLPERVDLMAEGMRSFIAMPKSERLEMGAAGRKNIEEVYDYKVIGAKLARILDEVVAPDKDFL